MFVQTEPTPNPATLKFLPGKTVMEEGTIFFQSDESAENSPLATNLFAIRGVESVFFGSDFITITKADSSEWPIMKPAILGSIIEHFTTNKPILIDKKDSQLSGHTINEDDTEVVVKIKELLDSKVRPAVAMDGGDIQLKSYKDGVAEVMLKGSCAGCPSSAVTLKQGVERMIKHYVPEVNSVTAVSLE